MEIGTDDRRLVIKKIKMNLKLTTKESDLLRCLLLGEIVKRCKCGNEIKPSVNEFYSDKCKNCILRRHNNG